MYIPKENQQQVLEQPAPPWAIYHPLKSPGEAGQEGVLVPALLQDAQHHLELSTLFHRVVYFLPNHASVQHGSRIEISFAPENERILFHDLHLIRDGVVIDLMPTQEVRVLSREARMERYVFDGRLLAVLVLNDVRSGDIVDYSYSVEATKAPLFGRQHGQFLLRGNFSVEALRCRLLYREGRSVYVAPRSCDDQPQVTFAEDNLIDCRWERNAVKPLRIEADAPTWAYPLEWIDYGEFFTWTEVAAAAGCLFATAPGDVPEYVTTWLNQVRAAAASPGQFILQLVRYVQEHVRYVSVSLDEHSHTPYSLATILQRNYGDCKDKTTLLCALLRQAGFDAVPALVNAHLREHAVNGLARPHAFNHVITRLRHADKTYWIDATLTDQGGQLDTLSHPPFGVALVLDGTEDCLVAVPPAPVPPSVNYDEQVTVHRTGGTAEIHITRTFFGALADDMRHRLTVSGFEELEKALVTDYRRHYPEVSVLSAGAHHDNRDANQIAFVHTLKVGGIWKQARAAKGKITALFQARFPASGMLPLLRLPAPGERLLPYAQTFPLSVKSSLRVQLPHNHKPGKLNGVLKSAAFECHYDCDGKSNSGWVTFQYKSLNDHVLPKDLPEHDKAIRELDRLAFYYVHGPAPHMGTAPAPPVHSHAPGTTPSHVPPRRL